MLSFEDTRWLLSLLWRDQGGERKLNLTEEIRDKTRIFFTSLNITIGHYTPKAKRTEAVMPVPSRISAFQCLAWAWRRNYIEQKFGGKEEAYEAFAKYIICHCSWALSFIRWKNVSNTFWRWGDWPYPFIIWNHCDIWISGASPALMGACVQRNIDLSFLSASGRFLPRVSGEVRGNVTLRKQQYRLSENDGWGHCGRETVSLARCLKFPLECWNGLQEIILWGLIQINCKKILLSGPKV